MSDWATGWQIICPDGESRHYPYTNRDDARGDADSYSRRGCAVWRNGERVPTDCPGGSHRIEPVTFPLPAAGPH